MTDDEVLGRLFRALLEALTHRPRVRHWQWTLAVGTVRVTTTPAEGSRIMLLLPVDKKAAMSVLFVDGSGNPARVDGVPAWNVSDAAFGMLTAAEDGMSAEFVPSGALGTLQISVQADADLGAGTRLVAGVLDVQIEAGEAVAVQISANVTDR